MKRKALICGSSKGIGKACAIEMAKKGYSIVLLALNGRYAKLYHMQFEKEEATFI